MRPERCFLFRLALALGKTVGQLLDELSSEELGEWMAYARIEPFGAQHENMRSAIVASAAASPGSLKDNIKILFPPPKPKSPPKKQAGWKALQAAMIAMTRAMGGKIIGQAKA